MASGAAGRRLGEVPAVRGRGGGIAGERVILMMWGYGAGWGWGAWLTMGVGMILFWGLVIGGGIALVRYLAGTRYHYPSSGASGRTAAEQILAERFARGDIDEDEYRQRRELLRSGG